MPLAQATPQLGRRDPSIGELNRGTLFLLGVRTLALVTNTVGLRRELKTSGASRIVKNRGDRDKDRLTERVS